MRIFVPEVALTLEDKKLAARHGIDRSNVASEAWVVVPFGGNEVATLRVISQQGHSVENLEVRRSLAID